MKVISERDRIWIVPQPRLAFAVHLAAMSKSPRKAVAGLPSSSDNAYSDIHMNTAKGFAHYSADDIHMATAKGLTLGGPDIRMETARGGTTMKGASFQLWERELLDSGEVRRKSTVAQLCAYAFPAPRARALL